MHEVEQTLLDQPAAHMAWWSGPLSAFRRQRDHAIIERLNLRLVENKFTAHFAQLPAWADTVRVLRSATDQMPERWRLLFEYPLLRLGRRIDVVLVTDKVIFVMEFKTDQFNRAGRAQAEDYALDLRDFHAGSRNHPIVPILVAGRGTPASPQWPLLWNNYNNPLFEASELSLRDLLTEIVNKIDHQGIDIGAWEQAAYRPVPNIIEAARMLYQKHGVDDIRSARDDTTNLTRTTNFISQMIARAKAEKLHLIIFLTGIPGAGKTLCGLDLVFSEGSGATFLTGTLPMIYVLKEALAKDDSTNNRNSKASADRKAKVGIQSVNQFLKYYQANRDTPAEHVIVFDEAQRAWTAQYGFEKFKLGDSEAAIILEIMRRHQDYAVVIALVGNGQEINTGEGGLDEWGKALLARPEWHIRAPASVIDAAEQRQCLFKEAPANFQAESLLHLNIPVRQVRSAAAAPWVDAVIRGRAVEAQEIARQAGEIPFYVTRSLFEMRGALRRKTSGSRRSGLVCSSGAKRLVADGLWPRFDHVNDDVVANWFLQSWPDVRASDALETPATEFACQGLELDYVGLCWGGDLFWQSTWRVRRFWGTNWQNPAGKDARDYRLNTYRVLLTRARYETIIWVPEGDVTDKTREPALFDQTVKFLLSCGAKRLEHIMSTKHDGNGSMQLL